MFVPVVATNEFAKNMILVPKVGSLPQTQQLKLLNTLMPQTFCKNSKILKKNLRQLEVLTNPAEVCQNDPDGYQAAAFVPSKVSG